MNFGFMAIEHMLATQTSSTKCLPYGYFLTKVFQYFVLNLVGIGDHISIGKIYNKHTFKRMGFSRNEEGMLVREGQEVDDENDEEEEEEDAGQDAMSVDEEVSEEELEEETFRREMRQKKRQERVEEGQSSGASMNSRFDALDGKISDIQGRVIRLEARGREEDI
ncbi:hypothetical protein M9H77_07372 [Catharanthus roseus]|uniref:Uncharacterized protein n=1 Tax=Catharanthus roseus TaxID=4058 RepID=A0ACC0BV06_CATRO|nr:hypothetical protein M9H77_07372 [Catharanthus roseus]